MPTELGKAYVQIIPSAKGIAGIIEKELGMEVPKAGKSIGMNLGNTIKKVLIGAGIGKALQSAIMEGGKLEQSIGGIETLFKDNASKVKQYAQEAYKTTGLSANAYMESVTGFSASLLQSLGGDTAKAAEISNMAMIDMADNSNKMGSSMESIQNAYAGFAKSNYTMLDNLKLGYGGTKSEMERLLADAEKLTGVKYDINNLSDVYEAIHAIQGELDITGTTAKEASTTIMGSFSSMKASFSNFLGSLAIGKDIKPALKELVSSTKVFLVDNLLPMVWNVVKGIPEALYSVISESLPGMYEKGKEVFENFIAGISDDFPLLAGILTTVFDGIKGAFEFLAPIFQSVVEYISNFRDSTNLTIPIVAGLTAGIVAFKTAMAIQALIEGVNKAFIALNAAMAANPFILVAAAIGAVVAVGVLLYRNWDTVKAKAQELWSNIQPIFNSIKEFISNAWETIKTKTSQVWETIKSTLSSIWEGIKSLVSTAINIVKDKVSSIWETIKSTTASIWDGIKTTISNVWNTIKTTVSNAINSVKTTISNIWNSIKETTTNVWNGIKTAIETPMNKARDFIKGIIDKIKGFFNFQISWPRIPMPHFSITPPGWKIGDLLHGSIPRLGISWNAEGGIFTQPTVFNTPQGLQGFGEAGAEAILPLKKLPGLLMPALNKLLNESPSKESVTINNYNQFTLENVQDLTREKLEQISQWLAEDMEEKLTAVGGGV